LPANNLPPLDCDDEPVLELDLCAAPPPAKGISLMDQDLVAPGVNQIDVLVLNGDRLEGIDQPDHEVPGSLSAAHLRFRPLADG
jgi:hypothetical protein